MKLMKAMAAMLVQISICALAVVSEGVGTVRNEVSLQLPPAIYAVPGVECNVYFDNIVLVINPANYVFDVTCRKGENRQDCWSYIPKPEDVGTYDWFVKVIDMQGTVAEGSMKLVVVPAEAGEGREISMVLFGDSLTDASCYPVRLHTQFQKPGNPRILMGGTNGPGNVPGAKGVAYEGWGGWTWDNFVSKKEPSPVENPMPRHKASPLFFERNGEKFLDAEAYFETFNYGRKPDFITFQLGVNDIFYTDDAHLQETIKAILESADKLISLCRAAAPEAIIGVGLVTPGCATPDGFGANYQCDQTRWQYRKNQHALNQAMLEKYGHSPDPRLSIIPTNLNLDCVHNFPAREVEIILGNPRPGFKRQCNGVHPSLDGYNQIGDTFYAWFKYQLSLMDKE